MSYDFEQLTRKEVSLITASIVTQQDNPMTWVWVFSVADRIKTTDGDFTMKDFPEFLHLYLEEYDGTIEVSMFDLMFKFSKYLPMPDELDEISKLLGIDIEEDDSYNYGTEDSIAWVEKDEEVELDDVWENAIDDFLNNN